MNNKNSDYNNLLNKLNDLIKGPVLESLWPEDGDTLTFLEALDKIGDSKKSQEFKRTLQTIYALLDMVGRPIIAVIGGLNAGKSSVVASFLSEEGRERLPRGDEDENGTHRFVYWVPSQWMQNQTTEAALKELLVAAHGNQVQIEALKCSPEEAAKQYRSGRDDLDKMQVPIIASDPNLNQIGAAFLDCPDIQTKDKGNNVEVSSNANSRRLEFVCDAARICSAFLVIWEASYVRDQLLGVLLKDFRKKLEQTSIYLLINKIRPNNGQPTRIRNDKNVTDYIETYRLKNDVYGAFDFDKPGWKEKTPPSLVEKHQDDSAPFPQFFCIEKQEGDNEPNLIDDKRFLVNLPSVLDSCEIHDDNRSKLKSLGNERISALREWVGKKKDEVSEIHGGLLEFCTALFKDDKTQEPLQLPTNEFTEAFRDSLIRTAPQDDKSSKVASYLMKKARPLEKAVYKSKEWTRKARQKWSQINNVQIIVGEIEEDLGIVGGKYPDVESLANEMKTRREWVPGDIETGELKTAWKTVIKNFFCFPLDEFQEDKLDKMTKVLWENMEDKQKFQLAGTSLLKMSGSFVALAGLVTAAVDGGATILASNSLAATISAWIPGFSFGLGGIAGLGGVRAGFVKDATELNTLPYLSRLFALSCDAFGIQRRLNSQEISVTFYKGKKQKKFILPNPEIPEQPTVISLMSNRLWKEHNNLNEIEEVLHNV